jgi:glycosyltransferase involved in cell wall biosynthesis
VSVEKDFIIGAVIPAYQEGGRIGEVVRRALAFVDQVVVVDDGSTDGTAEEARAAGARVVRHPTNLGKGQAIRTGIRAAIRSGWEAALFLDGDGQHDVGEIPRMLEAYGRTRAAIVLGNRMGGDLASMPRLRIWTNRLTSLVVAGLARTGVHDCQCGFRRLAVAPVSRLRLTTHRYQTESEMLIRAGRAGLSIVEVSIRTRYLGGPSHIRPLRDTLRFLRLVFGFL